MSQKVKRTSATLDDKEKSRTESPVKDMKKKAAANAEKEKAAVNVEKAVAVEKSNKDTVAQKSAKDAPETKSTKDLPVQKSSKDMSAQKSSKDVPAQKNIKEVPAQNVAPQLKDIPLPPADKGKDETGRVDPKETAPESKSTEKPKQNGKPDEKAKQNGDSARNGVSDVALNTNGVTPEPNTLNGNTTVSVTELDDDEDDIMIVDNDNDELFPELTYDDTSDTDIFEPGSPEGRSMTRRSQVKVSRTPETPRPASNKQANGEDKQPEENAQAAPDTPKPDTKLLKLKDDLTPMRLRSSDRQTPEPSKPSETKPQEGAETKGEEQAEERGEDMETGDTEDKESKNEAATSSKTDTNFSKSRVKISPYRRSTRLAADQTATSMLANYTGNNTTMETDLTLASTSADPSLVADDSLTYLLGLRSIRGRRTYKPVPDMSVRRANRSGATLEPSARPTGHVVGRKRKPADDEEITSDRTSEESEGAVKRMRLLNRVVSPFTSLVRRRTIASSTPLPARRMQPIVGINSDLPIHVPAVGLAPEIFDPETLKNTPEAVLKPEPEVPIEVAKEAQEHSRQKCVIM